jgi:hypothetical protein
MTLELVADFGIPLLVASVSYLFVRWSQVGQRDPKALGLDEPLINQP